MRRAVLVLVLLAMMSVITASANDNNIYTIEAQRGEAIIQDSIQPIATISSKGDKYRISIGGNINMKASYDFNGSINSPDFIPSMIAVPGDYNTQRRFGMDATTSRIEIKGYAMSDKLGEVELCLNADFRGGNVGSYMPRVRLAYISVAGFVVGRNFTTFCDLSSAAPNIDFQGPNSCPYIYTTQIRYTHSIIDNRLTLGAAIEYAPYKSSTLGDTYGYQEQYIPDIPAYIQYNWNPERGNHLRLTGLYKSIPLHDLSTNENININGWGTQISGTVGVANVMKLYYSGTCGEGITNYMQDAYGSGLDVTIKSNGKAAANFMYGWQAASLIQITDRTMISMGYSVVNIEGDESRFAANDYRQGKYIFGNIFYTLTSRIQLATEYLWGSRTNNNHESNSANRFNTMIQYNF